MAPGQVAPEVAAVVGHRYGGKAAGRRDYLKHIEDDVIESSLKIFQLKNAQVEDVLPILKQLLEVPEDKMASSDGSVRVAQEGGSGRLLVSGHSDKVARATEIIRKLDAGPVGDEGVVSRINGTPRLVVYPLGSCDGAAVLAVVGQLMTGQTNVRVSVIRSPIA